MYSNTVNVIDIFGFDERLCKTVMRFNEGFSLCILLSNSILFCNHIIVFDQLGS